MPIPAAHHGVFASLVAEAEGLFGATAVAALPGPASNRIPHLEAHGLSMLGEQWIVVEADDRYGRPQRWELHWDESGQRHARALLRMHAEQHRPGPTRADALAARIVALVGEDGLVSVATDQPEFDRVIRLTPRRAGALPFEVLVIDGEWAALTGRRIGWWAFGAVGVDDGVDEVWAMVQRLVLDGGALRTTWRSSALLSPDGMIIAGPRSDGPHSLRPRRLHFRPYHLTRGRRLPPPPPE